MTARIYAGANQIDRLCYSSRRQLLFISTATVVQTAVDIDDTVAGRSRLQLHALTLNREDVVCLAAAAFWRLLSTSLLFFTFCLHSFSFELPNFFTKNLQLTMSKEDQLIDKAKIDLVEAVRYDKNDKPNDALRHYMKGIDLLDQAVKAMSIDDERRTPLYKQMAQYITRAEQLKDATKIEVGFLEQRRISANSTGHGYDKIFGKCLDDKLTVVNVQDAYVSAHHQVMNFVRFCELVVSQAPNIRCINLLTGMEAKSNQAAFAELAQSLEKVNVMLKVDYSPSLHDREIRFNNGWIVKIGRGLDYFKNPGKYVLGASDLNFRPCHETTVDILKQKK